MDEYVYHTAAYCKYYFTGIVGILRYKYMLCISTSSWVLLIIHFTSNHDRSTCLLVEIHNNLGYFYLSHQHALVLRRGIRSHSAHQEPLPDLVLTKLAKYSIRGVFNLTLKTTGYVVGSNRVGWSCFKRLLCPVLKIYFLWNLFICH